MNNNLQISDNLIIAAYFLVVIAIGLYYARTKNSTADDYFFAGRKLGWLVIGFSIFVTNISSEHLVGLASAGEKSGLVVGHFEWLAIIFILALGWLFTPIFFKSKMNTIPELMGKKYNSKLRKLYSALSIFTYIFTKIAISLLAGSILLNEIFGWNFATSITIMLLFTGIYTIIGGLRSVMYTQIFQAVIFLLGGIAVAFYGLQAVGGLSNFVENIPAGHLELFKGLSDPEFPWLGILLGAPILAAWYWWADQYIVQRVISARDISQAKKGTLFGAVLKIFPFLFLILPGIIVFEMNAGSGKGVYDVLFSAGLFPAGIKGLIISGFFAAIMSSLAAAFNSTATLIAYDFFGQDDSKHNDAQLILAGRLSTIFIVALAILFIPFLRLFDNGIYVNLQKLQAYISPPIVFVFIAGLVLKRHSAPAAIWTLIIGEAIGFTRILSDFLQLRYNVNNGVLNFIHELNYLYFAAILFVFSGITYMVLQYFLVEKEVRVKSAKYATYINEINNSSTKKGSIL